MDDHNNIIGKDIKTEFPISSAFSLELLIDMYRKAAKDGGECIGSDFATKLVADIEKIPELRGVIEDPAILQKHEDLIDALMSGIFPAAFWDTNMQAVVSPVKLEPFYYTSRFERLFIDEDRNLFKGVSINREWFEKGKVVMLYSGLLKQLYNIDMTVVFPIIRGITDEKTGLKRYFKMNMDNRFLDLKLRGELPKITQEQVTMLSENLMNVNLWYEILPPHLFHFEGFMVLNMFEVTDQEALSMLKFDLLDKDIMLTQSGYNTIEERIRTIFRNPKLKLGMGALPNKMNLIKAGHKLKNFYLLSNSGLTYGDDFSGCIYDKAINDNQPVIIHDLETLEGKTKIEYEMLRLGIRNILVTPLIYEGHAIGMVEIGSPVPGEINSINALKLIELLPLFAMAMKRCLDDIENQVQALIKEKCTSIHPSVEWRFRQSAINLMHKQENDEYAQMEEIRFKDVYPLYALSDIRNSSLIRNSSIQADLKANLLLAKQIMISAGADKKMPVFDHLNYRIEKRITALDAGLHTGDEASIISFLKQEIEPLFDKLASFSHNTNAAIERYKSSLDPALGIVYDKRKDYEESVTQLNEHIAAFVEEGQAKAQEIYPHYFEKYKTDGVEFTMYIGDSIAEEEDFSPIYLKNIRLWQLLLMCGIAVRAEEVKEKLKVKLDLAHLILVQNNPLSIRFHFDQKKFDVDGAYNVHYEIMKKRIDKAEIRGGEERLTQPGKIAIVYTQSSEAAEYRQYIEYLQSNGILEKDVEELELEDLQGVYGLKALRVAVNANNEIFNNNFSLDEINNAVKEIAVTK